MSCWVPVWLVSPTMRFKAEWWLQNNLATLDDLSARHRTLTYEHERIHRTHSHVQVARVRLEAEVEGWKARCGDMEKRLMAEEGKNKELREEVGRGRKALDGVRIAAGVSSQDRTIYTSG